jgi:hypothetical protein
MRPTAPAALRIILTGAQATKGARRIRRQSASTQDQPDLSNEPRQTGEAICRRRNSGREAAFLISRMIG